MVLLHVYPVPLARPPLYMVKYYVLAVALASSLLQVAHVHYVPLARTLMINGLLLVQNAQEATILIQLVIIALLVV